LTRGRGRRAPHTRSTSPGAGDTNRPTHNEVRSSLSSELQAMC